MVDSSFRELLILAFGRVSAAETFGSSIAFRISFRKISAPKIRGRHWLRPILCTSPRSVDL
jgi:hypothetical protein